MSELLNTLGWIAGSGAIAWVVLALFAPSVLTVMSSWLTALSPLIKGIAEGLVEMFKRLWDGLVYLTKSFNAVLFVVFFALLTYTYGHLGTNKSCSCKTCIDNLRTEYKFVPRTKKERVEYKKQTGKFVWPWEGWFN